MRLSVLRLRTTAGLSLLALALGVSGTVWLTQLTSGGKAQIPRVASAQINAVPRHPVRLHHARPLPREHGSVRVVQVHRIDSFGVDDGAAASAAAIIAAPALVPVSTPNDASQPWYQLRGHLDGRVLVRLQIDGGGHVTQARVAESSGDAVLDEHALRSVRGWRFAVPANRHDGISGELPMRFTSSRPG